MAERFCTTLDFASVGFVSDRLLDDLRCPGQLGATRVGGVSLDSPRTRSALAAVAALSAAPKGFTVAELAAKVHALTGQTDADYSCLQAAYDLRKLEPSTWSKNRGAPADTTSRPTPCASSPPSPPYATESLRPSWLASANPEPSPTPATGPRSSTTTTLSASTWRPSSTISASRSPRSLSTISCR
jgi:hypothetical protein